MNAQIFKQTPTVASSDNSREIGSCNYPARLLIVSCSQRKRSENELMPALERYDGPLYQMIRKFRRSATPPLSNPCIYILSARFGLIRACTPIPDYDQPMTSQRAVELASHTLLKLSELLNQEPFQEMYLCLGKDYLRCIDGYDNLVPKGIKLIVAEGSIGKRLHFMKRWLYNQQMPEYAGNATNQLPARIRGVKLALSSSEVLEKGRSALDRNLGCPDNFRAWYVNLDGRRIAPKWLVSQITGLPVRSFGSDEARRLLARLGIEVCSIEST
ncbi:hypothetical protein J4G02_20290 [Candidatus Poribacteria bacterium]|nr:hypothetical protein [Candidatus Poribacteria bacterium]